MLVDFGHTLQDAAKTRHHLSSIVPIMWGEVGTTVERASIGCKKDSHGPATLLRQGLHCLHVNAVNVWPFFTVYFYRNKVLIHEGRNLLVLEGLALHHVAPVTGRVADAEQNGLILSLRLLQRFVSPRIPVHRVMRML